jgi:hypothetical protein
LIEFTFRGRFDLEAHSMKKGSESRGHSQ